MPTPATQPLPHTLASPVPTQIVRPVGSVGSIVTLPAALMPSGPPR